MGLLLLVPDFLLIVGGALLRRTRRFDAAFWSGIERLVYFVLFPALLFRSLALSPLQLTDALRLAGVGLGFTLAGMVLSALAAPLFRLPAPTFAACFQCGFRFNTYVALAVASRLAGTEGVAALSVLIGVLVPVVNVAAVGMLAHGRGGRIALELARNPLVLACVAGIAWKVTGWPMPSIAARLLELLASAALPLPALAWWNGVKLVALPGIALVLANAAGLPATERQIAVVMAAVPTATSAYILAMQMNGVGAPVALLISSGTLLAAVTLPIWVAVVA